MFDDMDDAIDYAREVIREVFFDVLYIIAVDDDENTECVWSVTRE